ncbi:hypothetical protein G1H11_03105 [Phytoactinopolyspora alkaliphila]|uniref:Glycoside hydrolase family 65 n=1 Tax=Phytoactinopolyspora alkaliphila TaxID=1783498 RepID=A0A6N9YH15_9ACTN|nr:hypothetical protein [Phytoactinopolyspora alkaliphila]NED94293.1 hypothetical protein [Phytoactinopolyspora alkaliphila]
MSSAAGGAGPVIDRRALVERHRVVLTAADVRSPLSVGNGEFCFTADVTGLQTFPGRYPVAGRGDAPAGTLLGTQSQWGWHSVPSAEAYSVDDVRVSYQTPTGPVPYVDMSGTIGDDGERADSEAERWLRANPHRLDLGRIGLHLIDDAGRPERVRLEDVHDVRQELDLWRGILHSAYSVKGDEVRVDTVCHPRHDAVAIRITSNAARHGRLGVGIAFSYGSEQWHDAADWTRPDAHTTAVTRTPGGWHVDRRLDGTRYAVTVVARPGTSLDRLGPHELRLVASSDRLELVVGFSQSGEHTVPPLSFDDVEEAAAEHWPRFWSTGGAVELAGSSDERAVELERRVVLSQYLTAINCAGSLPPQETGLVANSWFGRFHLEMHWWHAAHFALWGRPELLERSLRWYHVAAEAGRETARVQGYRGVRWPKQIGPDVRESPSPIGPFLIWQQPHPIYLAELLYRAAPARRVLEQYADIVFETAEFMASFAIRTPRGFELGPPLIPAQESYASMRARLTNPTFELAYWQWGLETAQRWRDRLGKERHAHWTAVAHGLVRPRVRHGVYSAIDVDPYTVRTDHPSMLCGLGFLPPTPLIDTETMRSTLKDVLGGWDWGSTWGWDYPVLAMCAARLGEPELAVSALSMDAAKNRFLPSGHNWQTDSLPLYLPGNGGMLAAVAMMAAGWDGSADHAPGFPTTDGRWSVAHEGLVRSP